MTPPTPFIVHHKAALDGQPHPPNSLEAIRACLEAQAACIEIDIYPLAGDDYIVIHDEALENETTGSGPASACDVETARSLRFKSADGSYRVALLSDVLALLAEFPSRTQLQLDYKHVYPGMNDDPLRRLARLVEPVRDRVIVTSCADWHLRVLQRLAPWLMVGFDPSFYLEWREDVKSEDAMYPPYRLGAYGYYDDHILSLAPLMRTVDYLGDRCRAIMQQVQGAQSLYVSHALLIKLLDDGFNWAREAQTAGTPVTAWTLDTGNTEAEVNAARLLAAGVRRFTTNTPLALGKMLTDPPLIV